MNAERKKQIDDLWKSSIVGKIALLKSKGKHAEAEALWNEHSGKYPPWKYGFFDALNKDVCIKIAKEVKSKEEFDEYLRELDAENNALVGVLISDDILLPAYDFLE